MSEVRHKVPWQLATKSSGYLDRVSLHVTDGGYVYLVASEDVDQHIACVQLSPEEATELKNELDRVVQ